MDTRELKEIIESVLSEMNVTGSAAAAEESPHIGSLMNIPTIEAHAKNAKITIEFRL